MEKARREEEIVIQSRVDYQAIAERIRQKREGRRWTQDQLAQHLGRSASYVGMIERGERKPSLELLVLLSRVLDLSLDFLIGGRSDPLEDTLRWKQERRRGLLDHLLGVLEKYEGEWMPGEWL